MNKFCENFDQISKKISLNRENILGKRLEIDNLWQILWVTFGKIL